MRYRIYPDDNRNHTGSLPRDFIGEIVDAESHGAEVARLKAQAVVSQDELPATASISRAQMFNYMNAMVTNRDEQIARLNTTVEAMESEIETARTDICDLCGKSDLIRLATGPVGGNWFHAIEPEPTWCEANAIRERRFQRQRKDGKNNG